MIEAKEMTAKARVLHQLLEEKLSARGSTLDQAIRRAGRRLPRAVRKSAAVLARAETMAAHPRTARQVDPRAVDRAYKDLSAHLQSIDVADLRKGRLLSLGASVAFNILVLGTGFIVWMWWRGFV